VYNKLLPNQKLMNMLSYEQNYDLDLGLCDGGVGAVRERGKGERRHSRLARGRPGIRAPGIAAQRRLFGRARKLGGSEMAPQVIDQARFRLGNGARADRPRVAAS
jgi:hypothetical protein